jgi:Tfp pilus assembly protein PilX
LLPMTAIVLIILTLLTLSYRCLYQDRRRIHCCSR